MPVAPGGYELGLPGSRLKCLRLTGWEVSTAAMITATNNRESTNDKRNGSGQ